MRMIPIQRVDEFKVQNTEMKKDVYKIDIRKASFKSEYDKQVETTQSVESKDEISSNEDRVVKVSKSDNSQEHLEKTDKVDNKDSQNETKKSEVLESKKNIKDLNPLVKSETKSNDTKISGDFIQNLVSKSNKEVKVEKNNLDNSKELKVVNKKDESEKSLSKNSDKNNLNQSIAGSLNIQNQVDEVVSKKLEENPESDSKKLEVADSEMSNVGKKEDNILGVKTEKASFNIVNNKDIAKENKIDKTEKNSKGNNTENKLKVNDLRSVEKGNITKENTVSKSEANNITQTNLVESTDPDIVEGGSDNTITVGTTELTAEGDGGKSQAPVIKEAASLLKQQLKDFGNNEIVKQSRFILKDNNVGEIKLILKPESLGQVKINLNLNENSLAGHIVVENNSVKEIFTENMNQLTKALEEQGYDSANLDVSLNDKESADREGQQKQSKQYFSDRLKRIDESGQVVRYGAPTAGINLTA